MANDVREVDIDTLERLLNSESDEAMEILPDGTIRIKSGNVQTYVKRPKPPLTWKQALKSGY